jgi:hypothetical protein
MQDFGQLLQLENYSSPEYFSKHLSVKVITLNKRTYS